MRQRLPVIAILDIGKTNKKAFYFDEGYNIVYEKSSQLTETKDEDGYPCEDIRVLTDWVLDFGRRSLGSTEFDVKGFNVSAYGASLVHLNAQGEWLTPLYNYLKPYPEKLQREFYETYGGEERFSLETSSPALGSLNSGMQLYWLKKTCPNIFTQVHYSLHLPQFIVWLLTRATYSDITSIGCHTQLWDFGRKQYHPWTNSEGVAGKLPPIFPSDSAWKVKVEKGEFIAGVGLHDSSAALIPYLAHFKEPFVLISTGTWCISLNPFNDTELTVSELKEDCLQYLDYKGNTVKASRLHAGNDHEMLTKKMAEYFHVQPDYYAQVKYQSILNNAHSSTEFDLTKFKSYDEAYHVLMQGIVQRQVASTRLVLNKPVPSIFVDGGFSQNSLFMNLLATAFPESNVYAASVPQASSLGAAAAIHRYWNSQQVPTFRIEVKHYPG